MIHIQHLSTGTNGYAGKELLRLLKALGAERVVLGSKENADSRLISLAIEPAWESGEVFIESDGMAVRLRGGSEGALLHAVYTFLEKLGCVFEFSGERLPPKCQALVFPELKIRHRPSVKERGIRMHLNFVQDQSFFSEPEFASFIDNMARQRFNYLQFHMYTPQQWFPFVYRGHKPLDHSLGNLHRKPLAPDMIGRGKIQVQDHWFPREFESIRDPEVLLDAMYCRYKRMMSRAHERGIRNSVSLEPESMAPSLAAKSRNGRLQRQSLSIARIRRPSGS